MQDRLGSVIAVTDGSGAPLSINAYDEYGVPSSSNAGRFQYTGQMWIAEAGLYHYKARAYAPNLGRFLQSDSILYADGMNLYAYVGGDPINFVDPAGERVWAVTRTVFGHRSHTFIVVAPSRGADPIARLSTGPSGPPWNPGRLINATGTGDATDKDDLAVWEDSSLFDEFVELDMSDAEAMDRIATVDAFLRSNNIGYDAFGNGSGKCNSNCGPGYIARIPNPFRHQVPGWDRWQRRGRILSWRENLGFDGTTITVTAYDILRERVVAMILAGVPSMPDLIPGGFGALIMRNFLMTEGQRMVAQTENMPQETMQTSAR